MPFFRFKSNRTEPDVTEDMRLWIEQTITFLIQTFGHPHLDRNQFRYDTKEYNHSDPHKHLNNVGNELRNFLKLTHVELSIEVIKDIRDSGLDAFEIDGTIIDSELEITDTGYVINLSNHITQNPVLLLRFLIIELLKVKFIENDMLDVVEQEDVLIMMFIASIHFGFGVLIGNNLNNYQYASDGFYTETQRIVAPITVEQFAYALTCYTIIDDFKRVEDWKNQLSGDMLKEFNIDLAFVERHPIESMDPSGNIQAAIQYYSAGKLYKENAFEQAIVHYSQVLNYSTADFLHADTQNNIGYCYLRLRDYENSIVHFEQSRSTLPNFGFATDNLGYVHIVLGNLNEAQQLLEKASLIPTNDPAYTARNYALYHWKKGELNEAGERFKEAYELQTVRVDLLDLYYGQFLIELGHKADGMHYVQTAVDHNEPEAIEYLSTIES